MYMATSARTGRVLQHWKTTDNHTQRNLVCGTVTSCLTRLNSQLWCPRRYMNWSSHGRPGSTAWSSSWSLHTATIPGRGQNRHGKTAHVGIHSICQNRAIRTWWMVSEQIHKDLMPSMCEVSINLPEQIHKDLMQGISCTENCFVCKWRRHTCPLCGPALKLSLILLHMYVHTYARASARPG